MQSFSLFVPRLRPTTIHSGEAFSHPPPAPLPPRENRGHCLNYHEDTHSFKKCRHPFIDASGCLKPELGELGDDDAYRRWEARMISYRRDGKSSRAHNLKTNRLHRPGQSRGNHQEQGQVNSHNANLGNPCTSGHHGGVPPSPISSAPAPAPGMHLGDAHNPSENPNARQPGTFRTRKLQVDQGTAYPARPPPALSGVSPFVLQDARAPVASLPSNAAKYSSVKSPRAPTVCFKLSRCNTGDGNPRFERGSAQPGNFDDGNTRSVRRSSWPWSKFDELTRAPSAVPLSRGIKSATGVRVSRAAPLNHGKVACASRAASPSHAPRTNENAAPIRRCSRQTCSPLPLTDHVVAIGLRCGKTNSKTPLLDHVAAVGLRYGKFNTKVPTSFARLDPVLPRDSSGRSIRFPIKEESIRLATWAPFSKMPNGKEPSRVRRLLPPTRASLLKTSPGSAGPPSSSRTLTHVHQAASVPVE